MAAKKTDTKTEETPVAEKDTLLNPVAAPENALVGDENIPPAGDVDVQTVNVDVPAQVTGPPAKAVETSKVSETFVRMDKVITDPSSPEAVQIPDAGRGKLDLPFHRLTSPRPEQVFSGEAEGDYTFDENDSDPDEQGNAAGRVLPTP